MRFAPSQIIFILLITLSAMALVYASLTLMPKTYTAHASIYPAQKTDLPRERDILLSRPVFLRATATPFKGLELKGQGNGIVNQNRIETLRKRVAVQLSPDQDALDLRISGPLASTLFADLQTLLDAYQAVRVATPVASSADPAEDTLKRAELALLNFDRSANATDFAQADREALEIRLKLVDLDAKLAGFKTRYGPLHPVMIELAEEQKSLTENLAQTQTRRRDLFTENSRQALLRQALEQEVAKSRANLARQGDNLSAQIRIVTYPDLVISPDPALYPLWALLSGLLALLLSALFARKSSFFNMRVQSARELEKRYGLPCIGMIPELRVAADEPLSPDALLAYKNLRQELRLLPPLGKKLVCITTAEREFGVTDFTVNLARLAQKSGERVLIMDCNLHAPDLQDVIPFQHKRNLVDFLSGQAKIEDVISYSDASGLHVVYGTDVPNTALDLLSGDKMRSLLVSLRQVYDLVFILAPPLNTHVETRVLGKICDHAILLVQENRTRIKAVETALELLSRSMITHSAFVLRVKNKK